MHALSSLAAALAATAVLAIAASATANAGDLTNREACLANGNTAEACECLERYVQKRAQAASPSVSVEAVKKGAGSAGDDLSAMGIVMQATSDGAKQCNVKSKK